MLSDDKKAPESRSKLFCIPGIVLLISDLRRAPVGFFLLRKNYMRRFLSNASTKYSVWLWMVCKSSHHPNRSTICVTFYSSSCASAMPLLSCVG